MAQSKRKTQRSKKSGSTRKSSARTSKSSARSSARAGNGKQSDAIELLKSDHRQVEDWFGQFEKTRSDDKKQDLADKICTALKAHTMIEEEIFYPAFLEATDDTDIHHEAEVEHDGAKKLIAEIESAGPDDEYFDARVTVLSEMIKHHVKEEEQRGGMFAKARQSDMDLAALGDALRRRKDEVMAELADERPARGNRKDMPPEMLRRQGRSSRQERARRS